MEADLVLVISPEAPLMKQLGKVLGKLCSMCDFTTIERGEKYITIQHDETGLVVAYTSEKKIKCKTLNIVIMNSINENGCSVCQPGKENYCTYNTRLRGKKSENVPVRLPY